MMDNVVEFRRPAPVERVAAVPARCLGCGHEWEAETPIPFPKNLECPKCTLFRGVLKGNYHPSKNYTLYVCNCGCDIRHLMCDVEGNEYNVCIGCGALKE